MGHELRHVEARALGIGKILDFGGSPLLNLKDEMSHGVTLYFKYLQVLQVHVT